MLKTEYEFTLPKGYVDEEGNLHREGVMRLATAADEILPLKDIRVDKNPAYLLVILFSRVIIKLGKLQQITPKMIECLFTQDLAFLQDFYNKVNGDPNGRIQTECPNCKHKFEIDSINPGEL